MLRYLTRAVPWGLIGMGCLLTGCLLGAVRYDAWTLWPMQGTAVGLLAGIAGWCLDEPAAAVVDTLPRGLAWQTTVRCAAVAVLVAVWSVAVWWAAGSLFGHACAVWWQGVAGVAAALAWVSWRRSAGEARPGQSWALVVVPVTTVWALVHPARDLLPVFPYGPVGAGDWSVSLVGWAVVGSTSAIALAGVLAGARWWPLRHRAIVPTRHRSVWRRRYRLLVTRRR